MHVAELIVLSRGEIVKQKLMILDYMVLLDMYVFVVFWGWDLLRVHCHCFIMFLLLCLYLMRMAVTAFCYW